MKAFPRKCKYHFHLPINPNGQVAVTDSSKGSWENIFTLGVYVPFMMEGGEEACRRKPQTSTTVSDLVLQLTNGALGPD